ncbi:FtsX-like permease family protein [Catellatospora citrea]|uniref:ABC transporter permease n=1 Tax=Catellatospora citrea TaxID=53366 RepID=UPI0033C98DB8
MLRTVLAGLRAHTRRLVATLIAVVLGVGFVAGTLIFGDTARAGFYDTFARLAQNVDVAVLAPTGSGGQPDLLTEAQLAAVRAVPGVAGADGRSTGPLALLDPAGRPITNFSRVGVAVSTDGDPRTRPFDIDGRVPAGPGEAVLDTETASHQRYRTGDSVVVVDAAGARHSYTLVGLIDFGVSKTYSGSTVVGLPAAELAARTGMRGYEEITVTAAGGVAQDALARQVQAALGTGPRVYPGDQRRTNLADEATSVATEFTSALLVFGVISLVVAAFVIYNTFAILLAQRLRETALLRCLGATRRQVFTATLAEAALIGTVGAAGGILFGIGVAYALFGLLNDAVHANLPAHAVVVGTGPVLAGLGIGLGVTVVAALLPALRATRTSPLAALRELPTAVVTGRARRIVRAVAALLAVGAGIAVTVAGVGTSDSQVATFTIVGGGVLAFLGVLIAAPLYIGAVTAAVGRPFAAVLGTPAKVAVANARRNPGRTATTTATLMIGIGLIALCSVLLGSLQATAEDQLVGHYPVDYAMAGVRYDNDRQAAIPAGFAQQLRARPEFSGVAQAREGEARLDGARAVIAAVDPSAYGTLITPSTASGTHALDAGTVVVSSANRVTQRLRVGDSVTVTVGTRTQTLTVAGTAPLAIPGIEQIDALVSWDRFTDLAGPGDDTVVLAKAAPQVSATSSRDALDQVATAYPLLEINSIADLTSDLATQINALLGLFGGLLGTAVLIALFGIANTLSLSVVERTRESATMRAIGLTRAQLRATLLIEALLMGVVGAVIGIAFGLVYGPLIVRAQFGAVGPIVVVPWGWLAGLVALAAAAAAAAAVLPARRAAKASIVAAMADL